MSVRFHMKLQRVIRIRLKEILRNLRIGHSQELSVIGTLRLVLSDWLNTEFLNKIFLRFQKLWQFFLIHLDKHLWFFSWIIREIFNSYGTKIVITFKILNWKRTDLSWLTSLFHQTFNSFIYGCVINTTNFFCLLHHKVLMLFGHIPYHSVHK